LAFDTTNFDTFIATTTKSDLARRGHAKSKRTNLRVVGLAVLASEKGHVPLLHRCYPGNRSDQKVIASCLDGLGRLHDTLREGTESDQGQRTIVRDGGSWSPQLELDLEAEGYPTLISLPLGHSAARAALEYAAQRGKMKPLRERLKTVRAARLRTMVGDLDRTLVVVESKDLLKGQKRGIAVALRKARKELAKLQARALRGRVRRSLLVHRVQAILSKEHLAEFVDVTIEGTEEAPTLDWQVNATKRRDLERVRLGKRVLCTDHQFWSTERIVWAFRGQWNVEELFGRAKGGGIVPWGPSHQRRDASIRLHTFATVLGLTLVSLTALALGAAESASKMMESLAAIRGTLVRTTTGKPGRRPTVMLPPELNRLQKRAVRTFELHRWMPSLLSSRLCRP